MTTILKAQFGWFVGIFSNETSWIEFHRKVHAEFTNTSGEVYVGVAPSVSVKAVDLRKPAQILVIKFTSITNVVVTNENGRLKYTPIKPPQESVEMNFEVAKIEEIIVTENDIQLKKLKLTIISPPNERLVLSFNGIDFQRYEKEVISP